MKSKEITKYKNQDIEITTICGKCNNDTKHLIITDVSLHGKESMSHWAGDLYQWNNEYQIIKCLGCETISFRYTHTNSEDAQQHDEYGCDVMRYPNPDSGREVISDSNLIPEKLLRIYKETLIAINHEQRVLAGIGVRAIVETVCKEKEAKGNNLSQKINSLVEQEVLTKGGADILHKLRILGNDSAHEVKPHNSIQLGLAIDVIEHLLQGVYILPYHAEKTFVRKDT